MKTEKIFYNGRMIGSIRYSFFNEEEEEEYQMEKENLLQIIYPPTISWSMEWQRPHHILRQFAKHGFNAFFVDPNLHSMIQIEENFFITNSLSYFRYNKQNILYLTLPIPDLCNEIPYKILWYDIVDDEEIFNHIKNFKDQHQEMILKADIVTVSAKKLLERNLKYREDILYLPNACDWDLFSKVSIEKKNNKRIGFIGSLGHWLDYDLIDYCLKELNDYNFIFIGRIYTDKLNDQVEKLKENKNFIYEGVKSFHSLPSYLEQIDICIIPFKKNKITDAVSPIKLFEYYASGKLVVSTYFDEIKNFPFLLIARNKKEFVKQIQRSFAKVEDVDLRKQIREIAKEESWNNRFHKIFPKIMEKI